MKIHFDVFRCPVNYHGKNYTTICGPKLDMVNMFVHPPSTGYRFILYWPGGSWWGLDITFDRRKKRG